MQVRPEQLEEGDRLIVMTKAIVKVVAIEAHPDTTMIGARRVTVEFLAVWGQFDVMDIPPTATVERVQSASAHAATTEARSDGAYL